MGGAAEQEGVLGGESSHQDSLIRSHATAGVEYNSIRCKWIDNYRTHAKFSRVFFLCHPTSAIISPSCSFTVSGHLVTTKTDKCLLGTCATFYTRKESDGGRRLGSDFTPRGGSKSFPLFPVAAVMIWPKKSLSRKGQGRLNLQKVARFPMA